jgi:hypothetical protein
MAAVVATLLGAVVAGDARATEESPLEVAQPIWCENGVVVSTVTVIVMAESAWPGRAVGWTARPNVVQREGIDAPLNRNAASMYGVEVRVLEGRDWATRNFSYADTLDTLNVVLDLRKLNPGATDLADSLVVEATVECILTNAGHDQPSARHVNLTVEGSQRYAYLQRVYRLGDYRALPRRRVFD